MHLNLIKSSIIIFFTVLLIPITCFYFRNNGQILQSYPPFHKKIPRNYQKVTTYLGSDFDIPKKSAPIKGMYARAYCLYDPDTNRVIYGRNETEKLPMASTTKIMTCIIALEEGKQTDKIRFSGYAASMPDVQLNAKKGDTFYLKDLLYSLMLESHNDTAVAIAEHIGGSVEGFAEKMNKKARLLNCKHTHFVTPNGLDDKKHYTTAADLCKIAGYAIKNKDFLKIIGTQSYSFQELKKKQSYQIHSHNLFLTSYPGAIGIKTGYTGNAGYCFCGAAKRNGMTLISSVLASGFPPHKTYKWSDTRKLMDYGFQNYKQIKISPVPVPRLLSIFHSSKDDISLQCKTSEKLQFTLSARDTVTHKTELPSRLKAPIRKGDIVGYEKYYQNGTLLYQFPILAGESADVRDKSYYRSMLQRLFLFAVPKNPD